jgi:hypothetical protein
MLQGSVLNCVHSHRVAATVEAAPAVHLQQWQQSQGLPKTEIHAVTMKPLPAVVTLRWMSGRSAKLRLKHAFRQKLRKEAEYKYAMNAVHMAAAAMFVCFRY